MASRSRGQVYSRWFEHSSEISRPFRLFCFPYAGGGGTSFGRWSGYFPQEIDICVTRFPGHGRRVGERSFVRLDSLVTVLADEIAFEIDSPFAFYGHSMGALVSFELARELFRRGTAPSHLFLSGCGAPHLPRREPTSFNLPEGEFLDYVKRINGTPAGLLDDPAVRQVYLPVLRADFEVVNTYQYCEGPPLPCPLSIYGGLQDDDVPVESLPGWASHTTSRCDVRLCEGGHFFIHDPRSKFVDLFRDDVLNEFFSLQDSHPALSRKE